MKKTSFASATDIALAKIQAQLNALQQELATTREELPAAVEREMRLAQHVLFVWEAWGGPLRRALRSRGLAFALDYMHAEDEQTNYVCRTIGRRLFGYHSVDHLDQIRAPNRARMALVFLELLDSSIAVKETG